MRRPVITSLGGESNIWSYSIDVMAKNLVDIFGIEVYKENADRLLTSSVILYSILYADGNLSRIEYYSDLSEEGVGITITGKQRNLEAVKYGDKLILVERKPASILIPTGLAPALNRKGISFSPMKQIINLIYQARDAKIAKEDWAKLEADIAKIRDNQQENKVHTYKIYYSGIRYSGIYRGDQSHILPAKMRLARPSDQIPFSSIKI